MSERTVGWLTGWLVGSLRGVEWDGWVQYVIWGESEWSVDICGGSMQ